MNWLVTWDEPRNKSEIVGCEAFATEEEAKHKARELTDLALDSECNPGSWEIAIWQLRHEVQDHQDGPILAYVMDRECNGCDAKLYRREDGILCEYQSGNKLYPHNCPAND